MAARCCSKPITRIIRVAEFDAGLIGLDQALREVSEMELEGEGDVGRELFRRIKEFGNYVSSSREDDYREALLREYRTYVLNQNRHNLLPHRGGPRSPEN